MSAGKVRNVSLIGMPGAGKSTVGPLLAMELSMIFVDTDPLIEARWGLPLQKVLDSIGLDAFCAHEEDLILSLDAREHVIATGGSVVYSSKAMEYLKNIGKVVWLDLHLEELWERLGGSLDGRGIVRREDQQLTDLHEERVPLYERYADIRVMTAGKTDKEVVQEILAALNNSGDSH